MDHLIGTPTLKPYMHGYFLSLKLYDAARAISNPFAYEEHKARKIQEKLDKMAEGRIRARKNANVPKVNKALAERIRKEEEREEKKEARRRERKKSKAEEKGEGEEDETMQVDEEKTTKANLLNDSRFSALFENPEFEVDEESREFNLLNPSLSAQKRGKTAVEEEEEDSDRRSSSLEDNNSDDNEEDDSEGDSSDEGDLNQYNPRSRPQQEPTFASASRRPQRQIQMVAAAPKAGGKPGQSSRQFDKEATFGQRRRDTGSSKQRTSKRDANSTGEMEFSWVPSGSGEARDADDMLVPGGRGKSKAGDKQKRKGVETFGAGLERGGEPTNGGSQDLSESQKSGRTKRRHNVRSGSKNAFRGT